MSANESDIKRTAIIVLALCMLQNVFIRNRRMFFIYLTDRAVLTLAVFVAITCVIAFLTCLLWRAKDQSVFEPVFCFGALTVFKVLMLGARALPVHYRIAAWIVIGAVGLLSGVWMLRSFHELVGKLTPVAMIMVGLACMSMDLSYNTNAAVFSDYLFAWLLFSAPRIAVFASAVLEIFLWDA